MAIEDHLCYRTVIPNRCIGAEAYADVVSLDHFVIDSGRGGPRRELVRRARLLAYRPVRR
jgi:hypothetical protein